MKTQHEINLNRITTNEYLLFPEGFDEYKKEASTLLQINNMFLSDEDVLTHYASGLPTSLKTADQKTILAAILETTPHLLKTGKFGKTENGEKTFLFIDLALDYVVEPTGFLYDAFFIRKLRQTDLLKIPEFLDYQLQIHYADHLQLFNTFINICIRKYKDTLLKPEVLETIHEWQQQQEKKAEKADKDLRGLAQDQRTKPAKERVKREASDRLTTLSQEQTVLLIYYLQRERIILKDEYLSDLDAGKAFEILTGYSQNTLRQSLSKFHTFQSDTNLKELQRTLSRLLKAVEQSLEGK